VARRDVAHHQGAGNLVGGAWRLLRLARDVGPEVARRTPEEITQGRQRRISDQHQEPQALEAVRAVVAAGVVARPLDAGLHPGVARLAAVFEVPLAPARQGVAPIVGGRAGIVVERLAGDHLKPVVRAVADRPGPLFRQDAARIGETRQQERHRAGHLLALRRADDDVDHPGVPVRDVAAVRLEVGAAGVGQGAHGVLAHGAVTRRRVGAEGPAGREPLLPQRLQDARPGLRVVLLHQQRENGIVGGGRAGRGGQADHGPERGDDPRN
jgi:hypothetical protein